MLRFFTAVALLLASPALAQPSLRGTPPDGYKFMSQGDIDKQLSRPQPGLVYGVTFANDHENYFVEFVKRLDHGNMVEVHPHWSEQITILSGEGVLTYGGTVAGGNMAPNGEQYGGTQAGATIQVLHPGDFVLIPAGQAHKFDAAPGATITYVVYKARS